MNKLVVLCGILKFTQKDHDIVQPFLKALGMKKAFEATADFSGMTNEPNSIALSAVYHKSFIGVSKDGIEAAAATAAVGNDYAAPDPVEIDLNNPFMYIIYEKGSRTPMFVGRVMDLSDK